MGSIFDMGSIMNGSCFSLGTGMHEWGGVLRVDSIVRTPVGTANVMAS